MIEILATCLIVAGTTFAVPDGWTADIIGASGTRNGGKKGMHENGVCLDCLLVFVRNGMKWPAPKATR